MDKKVIAAVICVVVAGAALGAYFIATPAPQIEQKKSEITVTDLAGRQVTVKVPVERVVLASARDIHVFAAVGGEEALNKIAGWGPDLEMYDRDTYDKYKEKFPEIEDIPEVGYHLQGTFSVERIISLKPDVVIFPEWIAIKGGVADDMAKLEQAGIPSIVIAYWEKPFETTVPSTILLGTVLGKEKRAREIVDFYQERVNAITSRLEKIDKPKPRVYVECGWKGPSEYGGSYGNIGWGAMVVKAGGINIAEDVLKGKTAPINPEYLLKENPDVIIISGSRWETPGAMRLGYYASPEESRRLLKGYTERPGWNNLSAVQNGRVYSVFHPHVGLIQHFAALESFAKWFYPEEFKNLDPEESFKEFHEKFLPVEYGGVWMLSLEEEP